jgi:DNA repair exonuclease SbcCD nuclease subunit
MGKILIVGDIHLDSQWVEDTDEILRKISEFAFDCEKIILLGDIYHRRDVQKGGKEELRFHKFLRTLPPTIEIHILTGNHDLSDDRNLLSEVKALPFTQRIFLYDEIATPFYINGKLAVMLPWEQHRRTDTVAWFESKCEFLRTLSSKFIVFGHLPFIEAKFNNTKMISNQSKNYPSIKSLENIPNFDFAFLGDIHLPQDVGNFSLYVGSIRNSNFAESGNKRVILLDTDTLTSVNLWLDCRDTYEATVKMADLASVLSDPVLTDKMVKLTVSCTQEEYEKGIGPIAHNAYDLKIEYEIQGKKEFKNLDITDDDKMFQLYMGTLSGKYGSGIIDKAKSVGADILNG